MFNFPVTVVVQNCESVDHLHVSVAIDEIAVVKPLLDKEALIGVESELYSFIPSSEIILIDGRKLPVLETIDYLTRYLDAYRKLENFYTKPVPEEGGVVIPLFQGRPCASSEGLTPD